MTSEESQDLFGQGLTEEEKKAVEVVNKAVKECCENLSGLPQLTREEVIAFVEKRLTGFCKAYTPILTDFSCEHTQFKSASFSARKKGRTTHYSGLAVYENEEGVPRYKSKNIKAGSKRTALKKFAKFVVESAGRVIFNVRVAPCQPVAVIKYSAVITGLEGEFNA